MQLRFGIVLTVVLTMFVSNDANSQALYSFDSAEDYFAPATSWTAWQETLDQHDAERTEIQACLGDEAACSRRLKGLRHILIKGAELRLDQQIKLVNRYINKHRYKDDRISSASGAGNQWETLTGFLHRGGDCEDFAVAKYFVLREFGVAADDMRIVVGRESRRATHHAMLAIRLDESIWLLENDNRIHRNGFQDMNRFVYAINEQGIWDHEKAN